MKKLEEIYKGMRSGTLNEADKVSSDKAGLSPAIRKLLDSDDLSTLAKINKNLESGIRAVASKYDESKFGMEADDIQDAVLAMFVSAFTSVLSFHGVDDTEDYKLTAADKKLLTKWGNSLQVKFNAIEQFESY